MGITTARLPDATPLDSKCPPDLYHQHRQPRLRRDKGYPQLTPRDLTTLTWTGEQYAVRFVDLQRLLARQSGKPTRIADVLSPTTTRDVVARWQRAGLVEIHKLLAGEPAWIWLTRAGLRALGLDYAPYRPTAFHLPHLHAVSTVRLLVEEQHAGRGGQGQGVSAW